MATTLAQLDLPGASERRRQEVVAFALEQIRGLPTHTAVAVSAAAALLSAGGFTRQSAQRRAATIVKWEQSRLPSTRLYLRLARSLVLFSAYDTEGALT